MLIEITKFVLVNEHKSLRELVPPEKLQNLLAKLMKNKAEKLGQFVQSEISKDYTYDVNEKRLARFGGRNLFDVD